MNEIPILFKKVEKGELSRKFEGKLLPLSKNVLEK